MWGFKFLTWVSKLKKKKKKKKKFLKWFKKNEIDKGKKIFTANLKK